MKKKKFLLLLPILAISLFLLKCGDKKESKATPGEVNYTLVSDLALRALLLQPTANPETCALAGKLNDVVHSETNMALQADPNSAKGVCCCPCDSLVNASSGVTKVGLAAMGSLGADHVSLKASGNNCPCPSFAEWLMRVPPSAKATVGIDDVLLDKRADEKGEWEILKLGDKVEIKDGKHTLKITGDFLGEGKTRTYEMTIIIQDGKPYMK